MKNTLGSAIALIGWFAVIAQFVLMFESRTTSLLEMTVRFFSFFTILTNSLVAIYFSLHFLGINSRIKGFFDRPSVLTAITVYITVVGLVYQVALRPLWEPTGMQQIVDELLHSLIPMLVIVYWVLFEKKHALEWKVTPKFLIYPLIYLAYILIRGAFSNFYPYPFVNVHELGWPQTLLNILALSGVFLILSFVFIAIGKLMNRQRIT